MTCKVKPERVTVAVPLSVSETESVYGIFRATIRLRGGKWHACVPKGAEPMQKVYRAGWRWPKDIPTHELYEWAQRWSTWEWPAWASQTEDGTGGLPMVKLDI